MYEAQSMAELPQEEVQQRIVAARMLRGISQRDLDRLASTDGYGKTEMSRVERGELTFRPGKHIEPLCRYLRVPRWWFTDETITLPEHIGNDATGQLAGQVEQVEMAVAEFQAWAERAVDRIIQDRTAAIARVDLQLHEQRDVLDALTDTVRRLARRDDLAPPGELGRRAEGLPPTAQSPAQAERRQAPDSEAGTG